MAADSTYRQTNQPSPVNTQGGGSTSFRICSRCTTAWHIGAVVEGEDRKKITFAQLEAMARGTFSSATLRTYSRKRRGANLFYPHITYECGEVRYDACKSHLVILRQSGIDTKTQEAAIAHYDRKAPTTRRVEALERMLARDQAQLEALQRREFDGNWMRQWKALNTGVERTVRWIDAINREHGFTREEGFFVTDRFTDRKAMLRSLFPELSDRSFRSLWRSFHKFLAYEGGEHLLRNLGSLDKDAIRDEGDGEDGACERE